MMYDSAPALRPAGPRRESLPGVDPLATFHLALKRVHKLLSEHVPGMSADPARLRDALSQPQPEADVEGQRRFALGWVCWLAGDLAASADLLRTVPDTPEAARTAYWL